MEFSDGWKRLKGVKKGVKGTGVNVGRSKGTKSYEF